MAEAPLVPRMVPLKPGVLDCGAEGTTLSETQSQSIMMSYPRKREPSFDGLSPGVLRATPDSYASAPHFLVAILDQMI